MSKKVRKGKDEKAEKMVELLIPFKRKKTDKDGFYYWIGQERFLIPESLMKQLKEVLAEYQQEDIIEQEGYHTTKIDNVSVSMPSSYIDFLIRLFG